MSDQPTHINENDYVRIRLNYRAVFPRYIPTMLPVDREGGDALKI